MLTSVVEIVKVQMSMEDGINSNHRGLYIHERPSHVCEKTTKSVIVRVDCASPPKGYRPQPRPDNRPVHQSDLSGPHEYKQRLDVHGFVWVVHRRRMGFAFHQAMICMTIQQLDITARTRTSSRFAVAPCWYSYPCLHEDYIQRTKLRRRGCLSNCGCQRIDLY